MILEISQMLGQDDNFIISGQVKVVDECIIIVPDFSTTGFAKYMGAFHSFGKAINLGSEHIAVFAYPVMGHARLSFFPKNEFYSDDNFYFMLMSVEQEEAIKNAIKNGSLKTINFEIQPSGNEVDFGNI